MPTTLPLFALFALFAVGSAQVASGRSGCPTGTVDGSGCHDGELGGRCWSGVCSEATDFCSPDFLSNSCGEGIFAGTCDSAGRCVYTAPCAAGSNVGDYCANDNIIGNCDIDVDDSSKLSCITTNLCTSGGTESCGVAPYIGECTGSGNRCKFTKKNVQVKYIVKAETGEQGGLTTSLDHDDFQNDMEALMRRPVESNETACTRTTLPVKSNLNGALKCGIHHGDSCTLECSAGYAVSARPSVMCDGKLWKNSKGDNAAASDVGQCSLVACTNDSTLMLNPVTGFYEKSITGGTLSCTNNTPNAKCSLLCKEKPNYRVVTAPDYTCKVVDGEPEKAEWEGSTGACGPATDISVLATVGLQPGETLATVIAENDQNFNMALKKQVAALLDNVMPENVIIIEINPASRRLNERSVLVNYTVRAAEGVDGTHSPEDDASLPVGGGS